MSSYVSLVREVAEAHRDEIEADLRLAIAEAERTRAHLRESEARVQALRSLAALVELAKADQPAEAKMTLHEAMATVLREVPEHMMRAGDLAAEIQHRRLYQMRDGRPVEPQQIHARVGHYPDWFEKVGTFIKLCGEHIVQSA